MKRITKGDWDGFLGLGLNNFVNLLLIINLSLFVLGFSAEFVATRVLPGMAVGLLFGNLFYAWQAKKIGEATGKHDTCAMPYGINLLPIFFYTFYVMQPAQQIALAGGASKEEADTVAWTAGVLACFGSGLIESIGSFFVHHLRRFTTRAAMLSALASVGIFFIAADYVFRAYAFPLVGLPTLLLTLYIYFGNPKLRWNLPGGLIVLGFGILLCWGSFWAGMDSPVEKLESLGLGFGLYLPIPYGLQALTDFGLMLQFAAVIIPMGLLNLVGSLQAIESAEAAGDHFPARSTLLVNGLGTIIAGGLGSPYPTTLYIGHLSWKRLGARYSYSLMNGVALALLCFTGGLSFLASYVPVEAGMAILVYIGLTIGSQAFEAVPVKHFPAVVVGLVPGVAAFTALVVKRVLSGVGYGTEEMPFTSDLLQGLASSSNLFATGIFALEQGWLYLSIVLACIMVAICEGRLKVACGWIVAAAVLSSVGILHSYEVIGTDITGRLGPDWNSVIGYVAALVVILVLRLTLVKKESAS